MTYLSRILLNPLRTKAQSMLRNPRILHAAVLQGLAQQPVTERVLWRLDTDKPHQAQLLVLTRSRPSWEHLVEQAGWPAADNAEPLIKPYQPLLDQILRGREFAFLLKANPVSATKNIAAPSPGQKEYLATAPRPRGLRVPHRTVAHQLAWLIDRLPWRVDQPSRWGLRLLSHNDQPAVRIIGRQRLSFTKNLDSGGHRVVLETATYEGLVRVEDPVAATDALLNGVGPGKAYGLGLITLAPPHRTDHGA
jgi:CRISPR system Cascade subunit CasE